jgi:hypothetical protein
MIIEFAIIAALSLSAIVGSVLVTVRDGYRRVPSTRA